MARQHSRFVMRFTKQHWPFGLLAFFKGVLPLMLAISVVGCGIPLLPPEPRPPIVEPDVKPVPVDGVRVLIVYESDANNSRETLNTLNSTALLSLLNEKAQWRKWDKTSIDASGLEDEEREWREIWAKTSTALGQLPKIVIVRDGKAGIHPLPSTEAATIEFIKKAVQ